MVRNKFILIIIFLLIPIKIFALDNKNEDQYLIAKKFFENGEFFESLEILKPLVKENYPKALNLMGIIYDNGDGVEVDYKKAVDLYLKAHNTGLRAATFNLGTMYQWGAGVKQDYKKARLLYKEAHEKGYASATKNLAGLYHFGLGVIRDYGKSLPLLLELDPNEFPIINTWIGEAYQYGGDTLSVDLEKAKIYHHKALNDGFIVSLINLGSLETGLGNYSEGLNYFEKALSKFSNKENYDLGLHISTLISLLYNYNNLDRHDMVIETGEKALILLGKIKKEDVNSNKSYWITKEAEVLKNIGHSRILKDDFKAAEKDLKKALLLVEKSYSTESYEYSAVLDNLSFLHSRTNRMDLAIQTIQKSISILAKCCGYNTGYVADQKYQLAKYYQEIKAFTEAENLLLEAMRIEKIIYKDSGEYMRLFTLQSLSSIYLSTNRPTEAIRIMDEVVHIIRKKNKRDGFNPEERSRISYQSFFSNYAYAIHDLKNLNFAEDAFLASQEGDDLNLTRLLNENTILSTNTDSSFVKFINKFRSLKTQINSNNIKLSRLSLSNIESGKETKKYQIALEERNSLLSDISVLREKFYTQNSDYADLFNPTPLSFSEVQGLLSSNEMIFKLSYSEDSEKLLAFAVTKSAAVSQKINLSSFELYNIVKELREDVDLSGINKLSNIPEFDLNLSYKLYRKLFGPFDSIMKDIDHLVVVPSGPLESLPFNLLVTEKPRLRISKSIFDKYQFAEWLPKKYSLTQLPTISSLKSLRSHKQNIIADEPFIGFGDPILEGQPGELRGLKIVDLYKGSGSDLEQIRNLPNLPETANELRIIARYLNAPLDKIYLRERAREEIIKRIDLSNSQVIAFATHGLVSGEITGLSEPALVFTPPSELSDIDDGLLKASEIAQLKINAEIIVLSACNTAASTKLGAQGLTGLSRAFIYAGAKSLLVTNWSIDSEAASLITTEMFKAISSNQNIGRGEALRNAMLKLISHKDKKEYAHPAFWAPFSLIGEGQKLIK